MKITHLLAAGLMIAGLGVTSTAASAQDYRHDRGYDHRDDRGGRNWHGRDRHAGWNNHRRCHTEWRHHRRVTVCR